MCRRHCPILRHIDLLVHLRFPFHVSAFTASGYHRQEPTGDHGGEQGKASVLSVVVQRLITYFHPRGLVLSTSP